MHACPTCGGPGVPYLHKLLAIPGQDQPCFACGQDYRSSSWGWIPFAFFMLSFFAVPFVDKGIPLFFAGFVQYLALQTWWVDLVSSPSDIELPD